MKTEREKKQTNKYINNQAVPQTERETKMINNLLRNEQKDHEQIQMMKWIA